LNYKKLITILFAFTPFLLVAQVAKVELVQKGSKWELLRDGKPYYIKGVGGQLHLDKAVEIGANSIRTWSTEKAKEYLDEAHKRGLTVCMGLWVGQERQGFDYGKAEAVKGQFEHFKKKVQELKDHPALLMWAIGNEVNLLYTDYRVWDAVQDIAEMIHELDPNHPTTTVTAGLHQKDVQKIMKQAPDIDIMGINTYGDLIRAVDSVEHFGWHGPFIIAEWGPNGHWEVAKTPWGAPIEQSSSEKAASYEKRYAHIAASADRCLGSYVFQWGQKQETTSTWYGLFDVYGNGTEPLDRLYQAWKSSPPPNSCPRISSYEILGSKKGLEKNRLNAGVKYEVRVKFEDPDNDRLKVKWEIVQESTDIKSGGDAESAPPAVLGLIKRKSNESMTFKAPNIEGAYRVFITAYDGAGNIGYVNIPFYAKMNPNGNEKIQLKKRKISLGYR